MSKLSELLNPAPSNGSPPSPSATHAPPQVPPLVLDGKNHRTSSISYGASGSPTHARYPSLTSPGLEALANAASNTAPIISPTQHASTFTNSTPYQPSYPQYGSRPSSSHTLPPLSNDFSQTPTHQAAPHSSGLEQYHHHSSGERRLSDVTDHSARLPPLQRSPIDQHPSFPDASQPLSGITDYAFEVSTEQSNFQSPQFQQVGYNPNAPATSQIRQPSPGPSQSLPATVLPETQGEQVEVKAEITEIPQELSKVEHQEMGQEAQEAKNPTSNMRSSALKNLADIKGDVTSLMALDGSAGTATSKPKAPPSRKRAAPKKGTASTVRPAIKKRKLDNESVDGTPQRTVTPATSRASNTPAPKNRKQGSVTPARSSSVAVGPEDEESEEDGENYCICRKPDDHTLMIACDGPCEDWFHARCVSMDSEKSKLIFKWYCPICAEKGHETLWKRMCRLEGCPEPARQGGGTRSKYCCEEHGIEFMQARLPDQGSENKATNGPGNKKKRRRANYTDNFGNAEESTDDDPGHLRGGVLKASELKSLADGVKNIDAFRRLGEGVLSPPPTASPEGEDIKMENGEGIKRKAIYTPEETAQLEEIAVKRDKMRAQKRMLDDRDIFLFLVTARAKSVLGELKEQDKSVNTICGYDSRLTWSDEEFNQWRASAEGKASLEKGGVLSAPTSNEKQPKLENGDENAAPKAEDNQANGEEEEEIGKGVCKKKRCERHKAWLKLMQQDILFETHQARQGMKKLEAEEKGVKDRAMIRSLEAQEEG